jgi:hypothetical protein
MLSCGRGGLASIICRVDPISPVELLRSDGVYVTDASRETLGASLKELVRKFFHFVPCGVLNQSDRPR